MPEISRYPLRMICDKGLDLVSPIDRMPEGSFPYIFNARVIEEGRLDGRPGYTKYLELADPPNSVRRLNDPSRSYAPQGYIFVGGGGNNLYAGISGDYHIKDSGYSGHPLSLIPFRPEQSPESWMYVYDESKQIKVRPDSVLRPIGVVPPATSPDTEYNVPAWFTLDDGQDASAWTAGGDASAPTTTDRTPGGVTISAIGYNSGTTGWCYILPSNTDTAWQRDRMAVILNESAGNAEAVVVREVHPAIPNTTVVGVAYDSGSTGMCSLVLTDYPSELQRNSIIQIGGENIRVLAVVLSPDGSTQSIRCSTANTVAVTNAVTGKLSWYVYTGLAHTPAETIHTHYVKVTHASGTGTLDNSGAVNASTANGRPVSLADDYLHVGLFIDDPSVVTTLKIILSLDATPNYSTTNPGNALIFTLTKDILVAQGASAASWVDVVVLLSTATRVGSDFTKGLANISGIGFEMICTGACDWGFDWLYDFGTYGPDVGFNNPIGQKYQTRFRDSGTGAKSVPGPFTLYELFPLRESVIITPPVSLVDGIDTIDIFVVGGDIPDPLYVGSTLNDSSSPGVYINNIPSSSILAANQPPDLTVLQPWPLLVQPWQGHCSVVGTSVTWVSGDKFNLALLNNSVILINGTAYLTQGNPQSDTRIQLQASAGVDPAATFLVASPTLAGQPLPFAFGALEGPFAPIVLALGDPINGGTLYYSNYSDADSASDANTLELAPPSSNLVSGDVWNGLAFAGNRDDVFCVRFSYLGGTPGGTSYQWAKIAAPSGIWSRWACKATPLGVAYLGRDGIYLANEVKAINITDERLYPLFPHEGEPAKPIVYFDNIILPVDMSQTDFLRLDYCDQVLRFTFKDTGGNSVTLLYSMTKNRWLPEVYANAVTSHYLSEGSVNDPLTQQILMLAYDAQSIMLEGGDTDNGEDINTVVLLPALDGGDDRSMKLFVDGMLDAIGPGIVQMLALGTDAQYQMRDVANITIDDKRRQYVIGLVTDVQSSPCGGTTVNWIPTTTPPDGVRTSFDFPQEPVYVSWNGLNQFKNKGYTQISTGAVFSITFIDENGAILTPGINDDIRAEVS